MAGAMRKVGEYLGLVEQADFDDEFDDDIEPSVPISRQPAVVRAAAAPVASMEEHRRPARRPSNSSDLQRIETVTPRTYNDARTVGEHYRSGVPVIMNLSEIDDEDAKRLVDFSAGLVFAAHGSINRVTAKVFLLSPENITVTDEDKQRIAAGGFYNQD
ncbi:cell division inhibitor SepF [Aeromicrobium panaciterrae]|uniref:Cell division protein SepF n=1 Tax=Aeromicrobium panaciterrae TaxID=363861 RepID=A0ABU1UPN9_9ACTN|nr:cell division protein SepF [Aeromicrobium panaciterrae]MDR7087149.1 cell division inhibitor SepF [Aeromicrobium panaciterrae]